MYYCVNYSTNEILAGPFDTSTEARKYGDENFSNYFIEMIEKNC